MLGKTEEIKFIPNKFDVVYECETSKYTWVLRRVGTSQDYVFTFIYAMTVSGGWYT